MRRVLIASLTAAAVLGAAALMVGLWKPMTPSETTEAPRRRASEYSTEEIARLRAELAALRRTVIGLQEAADSQPVFGPADSAAAPSSVQDAGWRAPTRMDDDERYRVLEEYFQEDGTQDGGWARAVEEEIAARFSPQQDYGSTLLDVECHSRVCRMSVFHESEHARSVFADTFPPRVPMLPTGTMRMLDGPNGELYTEAYLARPGHPLPSSSR